MTYNPSVPNAAQSPGLFPPQNSINFTRLKAIINAEHVFNNTEDTNTDGVHRQVTMIARDSPGSLPSGTNSILYTALDALGAAQLFYYNGATDVQLTQPEELYPIRIVGSATVTSGSFNLVYADPGFRWAGTGWALIQGSNIFTFYNLLRAGGNDINRIDTHTVGPIVAPIFEFGGSSGNNLRIRNNDASTRICVWSLIINRIE